MTGSSVSGATHVQEPRQQRLEGDEARASWPQLLGVSLLCGIGFTMSLFIGLLAFADDPALQNEVKVGILLGSLAAGLIGWLILRLVEHDRAAPAAA